jgi:hypothetical protein
MAVKKFERNAKAAEDGRARNPSGGFIIGRFLALGFFLPSAGGCCLELLEPGLGMEME